MPLPRATSWSRDTWLKIKTRELFERMGIDKNTVETAMFRYERGYPPATEFETDAFRVFELLNNLHRKEVPTNGGVKEGN